MKYDRTGRRGVMSVMGPAVAVVAAVLVGGAFVGSWLVAAEGRPWQLPLAAAVLALVAALGLVWLSRTRTARHLRAAAAAFAEREIARELRRKAARAGQP